MGRFLVPRTFILSDAIQTELKAAASAKRKKQYDICFQEMNITQTRLLNGCDRVNSDIVHGNMIFCGQSNAPSPRVVLTRRCVESDPRPAGDSPKGVEASCAQGPLSHPVRIPCSCPHICPGTPDSVASCSVHSMPPPPRAYIGPLPCLPRLVYLPCGLA